MLNVASSGRRRPSAVLPGIPKTIHRRFSNDALGALRASRTGRAGIAGIAFDISNYNVSAALTLINVVGRIAEIVVAIYA
jgi:hypothetical protein